MLADRLVEAQQNAEQARAAAAPVGNARAQRLAQLLAGSENLQRTLQMIRSAEGTQRYAEPERVNFGNSRNSGELRSHPNTMRPFNAQGRQQWTSATGAYQFLGRTWNGAANALGLKDFSRQSQDLAAVHLIEQRGGLEAAKAGNVPALAQKLGGEWASLGYNNYGQPTRRLGYLQQAFNAPLAQGGTEVAYAPDKGGVQRSAANVQSTAGSGGTIPNAGDFGDVNPVLAFMQSARDAQNSSFVSGQTILQQLMQEQGERQQKLLGQSQQLQQTPLSQDAPVLFGG